MAEHRISIRQNSHCLQRSLAAHPETVNRPWWNYNACLSLDFILYFSNANETFPLYVKENQNFFNVMPVKRGPFLALHVMQPDGDCLCTGRAVHRHP
jgi:hypothetical protein